MSTETTTQVLDTSYDMNGISVVTATKTAAAPRRGTIYNPDTLAAALPVWFHPLRDGRFLGLFAERWHTATIGSGGPQSYASHVETINPSWMVFDPATGSYSGVQEIPSNLPGNRDLAGAVSRFSYLLTIGTCNDEAHLQHHVVGDHGDVILQAEEIVPVVGGVSFSFGIWVDDRFLYLVGTDSASRIHLARKRWSRVGENRDEWGTWEYKGTRGWSPEPSNLAPLMDSTGQPLVTSGPVSYAKLKNREFISVMTATDAKIYSSRDVEPTWVLEYQRPADYLYLQPQLYYNPTMIPTGKRVGVPYVVTDIIDTANAKQLLVSWDMFAR